MATITLFTASRALQGPEVRSKLTHEFADLYDDLDRGFRPINFLAPWLPLPQNRRRDRAHAKMVGVYMDIISRRRSQLNRFVGHGEGEMEGMVGRGMEGEGEEDMIDNLMSCVYKSGERIPDHEIACLMITLLMAGQHSSSSSSSWIIFRLASRPDIQEELLAELNAAGIQSTSTADREAGGKGRGVRYQDLENLTLLSGVVKETLRLHSSIHSVMRKVKNEMPIPGTQFVVTTDKVLVASPIVTHWSPEYFADPEVWDPHRWDALSSDGRGVGNAKEGKEEGDLVDYGYGVMSKGTKSPYLPFGAGRHRCIGERFAEVNLMTVVATLVREFRWSLVDGKGEGEGSVPETDYSSMFSRPMPGSRIRWERR
ncbi:hypothetical protein VTL71DRAFT_7546 [Oculimacula yallundae]|uniref:Cytochrome P450 n=1 Tax=Oculimacula yallundae TaxID=86028 RepID=A0ABR4BUE7_9HELO